MKDVGQRRLLGPILENEMELDAKQRETPVQIERDRRLTDL